MLLDLTPTEEERMASLNDDPQNRVCVWIHGGMRIPV